MSNDHQDIEHAIDRRVADVERRADATSGARVTLLNADGEVDLRRILLVFWRRRYLVVAVMLLFVGAAYYIAERITPLYKASAFVLINQDQLDIKNVSAAQFLVQERYDTTQIKSEVEIIRSREAAMAVIKQLQLHKDPYFAEGLDLLTHSLYFKLEDEKQNSGFKGIKIDRPPLSNEKKWEVERQLGILTGRFLRKLDVRPMAGTKIITIKYTSPSAEKAKLITDAIAHFYVNRRLELKYEATQKVTEWLDGRLSALRGQLREAETAVENYRANNDLITGSRAEITAQQITEVNTQLVLARTRIAEDKARLEQLKKWDPDKNRDDILKLLVDGRVLNDLILKQNEIASQRAEMARRYGPKHPEMIRITTEEEMVATDLDDEFDRLANRFEKNLEISQARADVLADNLMTLEDQRKLEGQSMIKLRELENEAATIRQIFVTFLESYKKADQQEQLQEADARVISDAILPLRAFHPNKPLIMSLSAILGVFFALLLIVMLENLENSFRSALQIEGETGLPCVGAVPRIKAGLGAKMADYVLNNPSSAPTEAIRSMMTMLSIDQKRKGLSYQVLALTSSLPGEGKSTLSLWIARLAARAGRRAILIDCDLRRPNIHNLLECDNEISLVEHLTGSVSLDQAIYKDPDSGLDVILGRSVSSTALDLISSKPMEELVKNLRERYDFIVLDTPACMAVSDPCVLAGYADQIVYGVRWNKTPRDIVLNGLRQMKNLGINNISMVFSMVDLKKQARYGYAEPTYYYTNEVKEA